MCEQDPACVLCEGWDEWEPGLMGRGEFWEVSTSSSTKGLDIVPQLAVLFYRPGVTLVTMTVLQRDRTNRVHMDF